MLSTATRNGETTKTAQLRLRTITVIILVLLAIQFLVGMLVNLFVQVPSVHPGANAPEYFSGVGQGVVWALIQGPLWLLVHAIVGLLLFLASLILIGFAIAARRRAWIIVSVIGFVGIVAAVPYTIGLSLEVRRSDV